MRAHPGVQRDPPPAASVGVEQRIDLAVEFGLRQRLDHEIALPGAVALRFPVLDRAAAANPEMLAKRRDPLGARLLDREQAPAVGMTARHGGDLDRLAAQRVRHIDILSAGQRDAVAEMADMIDEKAFNHGARRGRIRRCRRRR